MYTLGSGYKLPGNRIAIGTGEYYYVSKKEAENYKGFVSKDVRDCVFGYISSDKGFAGFHFFRTNDPKDLVEKITKDFQDDTSIKIVLIGGNLVNGFLPWKEKNRDLQYLSDDKSFSFCGLEAMNHMNQLLNKDKSKNTSCSLETLQSLKLLDPLLKECSLERTTTNLFQYNYKLIDEKLSNAKFLVSGFDQKCTFKVRNYKDFTGYQNLTKILNTFAEDMKLLNKYDLQRFHCDCGSLVEANFDGTYSAEQFYNLHPLTMKYTVVEYTFPSKIKDTDQFFKNHPLKNGTASWVIGPKKDVLQNRLSNGKEK